MKDDGKVEIELELDRDVLLNLALMAHEQEITLNELIENILKKAVEEDIGRLHHQMLSQIAGEILDWCDSEDCTTLEAVRKMKAELLYLRENYERSTDPFS